MEEFNNYFKRQIELFGEEKQKQLQDKHILIVGSGGLGCSLAMAIGSSGIGDISIVDFDRVSIHNIHRQIAFSLNDENRYKVEVVKEQIESKSSFTKVHIYTDSFDNIKFNDKYDLIIDATDNLPIRESIDKYSKELNVPWIYGSVEEFPGQVCFFDKASFGSIFNISDHKPKGIAAPIVMQIASLQANLALRYLVGLDLKKDILYYSFFDSYGEYQLQKFILPV